MAIFEIPDGTTTTIADGETETGGPINLDGTLNLEGTVNAGEEPIAVAADAGLTTTETVSKEKDVLVAAELGLTSSGSMIEATPSLRRRTSFSIEDTRKSDYTVQGTGETE